MRPATQHRLNPQHVYCRLCDLGLSRCWSLRIARCWEWFYRRF